MFVMRGQRNLSSRFSRPERMSSKVNRLSAQCVSSSTQSRWNVPYIIVDNEAIDFYERRVLCMSSISQARKIGQKRIKNAQIPMLSPCGLSPSDGNSSICFEGY